MENKLTEITQMVRDITNYLDGKRKRLKSNGQTIYDNVQDINIEQEYMKLVKCFKTADPTIYDNVIYRDNQVIMKLSDRISWLHHNIFDVIQFTSLNDADTCFDDRVVYKLWKAFPEIYPVKSELTEYDYLRYHVYPEIELIITPCMSITEIPKYKTDYRSGFYDIEYSFDLNSIGTIGNASIQFYSPSYRPMINDKSCTSIYRRFAMIFYCKIPANKENFRRFVIEIFQYYLRKYSVPGSDSLIPWNKQMEFSWETVLYHMPNNTIKMG